MISGGFIGGWLSDFLEKRYEFYLIAGLGFVFTINLRGAHGLMFGCYLGGTWSFETVRPEDPSCLPQRRHRLLRKSDARKP